MTPDDETSSHALITHETDTNRITEIKLGYGDLKRIKYAVALADALRAALAVKP